jgi:hypothetical protein
VVSRVIDGQVAPELRNIEKAFFSVILSLSIRWDVISLDLVVVWTLTAEWSRTLELHKYCRLTSAKDGASIGHLDS